MAHSLEARSPLLDHELMEFAAALPPRHKAKALSKKALLRDAYRETVPKEILDGPKRGFGVPVGEWLRGPLREQLEDTLSSPDGPLSELLDRDAVTSLADEHQSGAADHGQRLWALLFLAEWCRSSSLALL